MLACLPILLYLDYTITQIKRSLIMDVMGLQGKWVYNKKGIRLKAKIIRLVEQHFFTCISIHQFLLLTSHHAFFFLLSSFFSFHSHYSFIHHFFFSKITMTFLRVFCNLYTPTLIFLHPALSSSCTSSTNPMIGLENIIFF